MVIADQVSHRNYRIKKDQVHTGQAVEAKALNGALPNCERTGPPHRALQSTCDAH